jgi:DMSO/TMAO reductase YedYZ molybdopterin-dependent catalytic subunit
MRHRLFLTTIACSLLFLVSNSGLLVDAAENGKKACQGGYSSRFTLTGEVNNPAIYDKASLGRLPHSAVNVTFMTKTGSRSSSFRGVLLWNLLMTAGIKSDHTRRGRFQYVEITTTDCYQVVLALAELDPNFGGEQVLVADSQNGSPLGPDTGFARIIVPGDKFGGRDTFWIEKIEVLSGPPPS